MVRLAIQVSHTRGRVGDGDVPGTEDIHVRVPPRSLLPNQQGISLSLSSHLSLTHLSFSV